jgi:hypothetical protein
VELPGQYIVDSGQNAGISDAGHAEMLDTHIGGQGRDWVFGMQTLPFTKEIRDLSVYIRSKSLILCSWNLLVTRSGSNMASNSEYIKFVEIYGEGEEYKAITFSFAIHF